jgi:hypothetical protein
MLISLTILPATLCSLFRSRVALELENLALRHQIGVLQRSVRKRPRLTRLRQPQRHRPRRHGRSESGRQSGRHASMEHTIPFILQWDENFDVGADTGTPVDDQDYQVPFEFNGKLVKLTLTIDRPQLTPADIQKLQAAQRNNKTSE